MDASIAGDVHMHIHQPRQQRQLAQVEQPRPSRGLGLGAKLYRLDPLAIDQQQRIGPPFALLHIDHTGRTQRPHLGLSPHRQRPQRNNGHQSCCLVHHTPPVALRSAT